MALRIEADKPTRFDRKPEVLLELCLHGHYEWVKLHLKPFRKRFNDVAISSIPCCDGAVGPEELNSLIDHVLGLSLGHGGWLRCSQVRLPAIEGDPPCKDRKGDAFKRLGIRSDRSLEGAKRRLDELINITDGTDAENSDWKRRRKDITQFQKESERLEAPKSADEKQEVKRLQDAAKVQGAAITLAHSVTDGLKSLMKQASPESSPDHHQSQTRLTLFLNLASCRRDRGADKCQRLQTYFETATNECEKRRRQERWTYTTFAQSCQIIRRQLDPKYNTAPDHDQDDDWDEKRRERRCRAFHLTINELYIDKSHERAEGRAKGAGANAWAVYSALQEQCTVISSLYKFGDDMLADFAKSAASLLRGFQWDDISDDLRVPHFPALLSWALNESFQDVCRYLGLDNLANEDPGMSSVLDGLASDHKSLQERKGDLSLDEYHSMTACLDWKVWQAMTIRLGDLRIIHQHATMAWLDDAGRAPTAPEQDQVENFGFSFQTMDFEIEGISL